MLWYIYLFADYKVLNYLNTVGHILYALKQCLHNSSWLFAIFSHYRLLWHCWFGSRKSICPVKKLRWGAGMVISQARCKWLAGLWSSWCHCHPIISALVKSRMVYLSGTSLLSLFSSCHQHQGTVIWQSPPDIHWGCSITQDMNTQSFAI